MSLSQLWPHLVTLRADPSEGSNMEWKVLYANRSQPLLVPLDSRLARRAIAFFIRNPLLRVWGNLLLTLDRWLPRAQLLPRVCLEHFPYASLFGSNYTTGVAMFCGFPGPLQKLAIYCPDMNDGLGKVAKVAMDLSANEAIVQEAYWLDKLNRQPRITSFLPRLLQQGSLPCGRRYFCMRSLPQGVSPPQLGRPHLEFLHALASQKTVFGSWRNSQAHIRLTQRTLAVLPMVDVQLHQLLLEALSEIEQLIGHTELPSCVIHGDFAPWNLRQTNRGLFVFDWEYAQNSGSPLQDFLHFHLIQRALQRWPLRPKALSAVLHQATSYAADQFGPGNNVVAASGALTLHYLLDTLTFYVAASGRMDYTHPVLRNYFKLLQQRAQWLPRFYPSTDQKPHMQHSG